MRAIAVLLLVVAGLAVVAPLAQGIPILPAETEGAPDLRATEPQLFATEPEPQVAADEEGGVLDVLDDPRFNVPQRAVDFVAQQKAKMAMRFREEPKPEAEPAAEPAAEAKEEGEEPAKPESKSETESEAKPETETEKKEEGEEEEEPAKPAAETDTETEKKAEEPANSDETEAKKEVTEAPAPAAAKPEAEDEEEDKEESGETGSTKTDDESSGACWRWSPPLDTGATVQDRRHGLAAFTTQSGGIAIYGGVGGAQNHPANAARTLSVFDPETSNWDEVTIAVTDAHLMASTGAAYAYEPADGSLYEFGGSRQLTKAGATEPYTNLLAVVKRTADGAYEWKAIQHKNGAAAADDKESPVPRGVSGASLAVFGKTTIAAFGGQSDVAYSNMLYIFSLESQTWSAPQPVGASPSPRAHHTMVQQSGGAYVYGGHNGFQFFGDLYRLSPPTSGADQTWTWEVVTPANPTYQPNPAPRAGVAGLAIGDGRILFGGGANRPKGEFYSDLFLLDVSEPDKAQWAAVPATVGKGFKARSFDGAAAALSKDGGSVVFVGGCSKSQCHDIYRPAVLDMEGVCANSCKHGKFVQHDDLTTECQCDAEYGGKFCDEASSCKNNCTSADHGTCVGGKCQCKGGFGGEDCSEKRCPNDCKVGGKVRGVCVDNRCLCMQGYWGLGCEQENCKDNCGGRGICQERVSGDGAGNKCKCLRAGFYGADCGTFGVPGRSPRGVSFLEMMMSAEPEAAEPEAKKEEEEKPAASEEEEKPEAKKDEEKPAADEEEKPAPKEGEEEEAKEGEKKVQVTKTETKPQPKDAAKRGSEVVKAVSVPFEEDFSCHNNCNGHGICTRHVDEKTGRVEGVCECIHGFAGDDCGQECTLHCTAAHRGQCVMDGPLARCHCAIGFAGEGCENTECALDCSGHGTCNNNECGCNGVWTGGACHLDGTCSGHGTFRNQTCECDAGYGGVFCAQTVQCEGGCGTSDRGECVGEVVPYERRHEDVKGVCRCKPGWTGEHCDRKGCENDCSHAGVCAADGTCKCYSGFAGPDCSQQLFCANNCTGSHGVCVPDETSDKALGKCECNDGWSGPDCNLIGCKSNCMKRGECIEGHCRCDDGYSGDSCETACPNKCSNQGICRRDGTCDCNPGRNGTDCSVATACPGSGTPAGECNGNGECHAASGRCFCNPDFAGLDCSQHKECGAQGCNGRGTCTHNKCFCDLDFEGEHCERKVTCEADCNHQGSCVHGRCSCWPGFEGKACEIRSNDTSCDHFGGCAYGVCETGICRCPYGAAGKRCDEMTHMDECRRNESATLCEGHGTCSLAKCTCKGGWTGKYCEQREVCEGGCVDGQGTCIYNECHCLPGFRGPDCSEDVPCPLGCSNQGVCVSGKCACYPGFSGTGCETLTGGSDKNLTELANKPCKNNCTDGGVCHLGRCFCVKGRDGDDCSIQTQNACPKSCSGHGVCRMGTCFCKPGRTGEDCATEVRCPEGCETNGVCAYGHCFCVPGWTGHKCDRPVDESERTRLLEQDMATALKISQSLAPKNSSSFCYGGCNRGTCINNKCFCAPNYEGANCQTLVAGPLSHRCPANCSGNGECLFGQCFCHGGHTGEKCDKQVVLGCPFNCNGNGVCSHGRCYCNPGYHGGSCSKQDTCPPECEAGGHGVCVGGQCKCTRNFFGAACNETSQPGKISFRSTRPDTKLGKPATAAAAAILTLDECTVPCGANGVCVNSQCYCKSGWTGADCATLEADFATADAATAGSSELRADCASKLSASIDGAASDSAMLSVASFVAGAVVCVVGQIGWEKYKEMRRKRITKDIFQPMLQTLDQ